MFIKSAYRLLSQLQHLHKGWGHLLRWVQAPHIIITVVQQQEVWKNESLWSISTSTFRATKKGTKLVRCKCRYVANVEMEGSGRQMVVMMNRERERQSSKNEEDWKWKDFQFFTFTDQPTFQIKIWISIEG